MSSLQTIRFSQFNASLNRNREGELIQDLSSPNNAQAKAVAEIIQRTQPDVLLINEFDYVAADPLQAVRLLQQNYLSIAQNGATPIEYPYVYIAPSNTGIASGFDLDNDGKTVTNPTEPGYGNDAFGFGNFPGQFGMLLLSKYPIDTAKVRTFQNFLWKDMPGSLLPTIQAPNSTQPWYSPEEQAALRLSSKSHWDVPILVDGQTIHVLVSHPTPPVFDGLEDRNGKRNHDEIRFWADYVSPNQGSYIYDDAGRKGGLTSGAKFVMMGDQNADPNDGDSFDHAILQLLQNPNINTNFIPTSLGAVQQAQLQGGANANQQSNPAFDTADFADTTPGNLRTDYVLPSNNLKITNAQVFWPTNTDPLFPLVGTFNPTLPGGFPSSDHRLVWADIQAADPSQFVTNLTFQGQNIFATGLIPSGAAGTIEGKATELGGLSGVTYDAKNKQFYAISDDRSERAPARFYTFELDLKSGTLQPNSVTFTNVTPIKDANGNFYSALSLDPEGISLTNKGSVFISSEGEVNLTAGRVTNPFVNEYDLKTGQLLRSLSIPKKFLPIVQDTNQNGSVDAADTQTSGVRNNLAFESLTISPDQRFLYTATENALFQDGAVTSAQTGTRSRILQFNTLTGQAEKEYLYITDPVAQTPNPATAFSTNGLVDLLAIDDRGTLLALERSFSTGAPGTGNTIKIYEIKLENATDISTIESLNTLSPEKLAAIRPAQKRLLLNLDTLKLPTGLDNVEGITFGAKLPDGRQSIVLVSDNNFSQTQFTQVLALGADLVPTVLPVAETPSVLDQSKPSSEKPPIFLGDADDPAIWVNPADSGQSLIVATLKDGGLAVFNLDGSVAQDLSSNPYGAVRYNNVDLIYGFALGEQEVDLAIASDRRNDTLAIFRIDPTTRQLVNITAKTIPASIFGIDDGRQTAYGLAAYTSPVSGKSYVFVSQRAADKVAQLELIDNGDGTVNAKTVRTLTVPIPAGGQLADAQTEGMVVDRETGFLYIGQENVGIWKFLAEPNADPNGVLIDRVRAKGGQFLNDDVEGLTLYYGAKGSGYLLASSQGDNAFVAYTREGSNDFVGRFAVGSNGSIDSVQESDGADVINVPLGSAFPKGLLVVQDGSNEPSKIVDGENINSNFKLVPWENVANPLALEIDTESYDPRHPIANGLLNGVASGDTTQTSTVLWARSNFTGDLYFEYSKDANFCNPVGEIASTIVNPLQPAKVEVTGLEPNTTYYYRVTDAAGSTQTGQLTTAAEPGTYTGLRFGATGDWRGELAPYPALSNAATRGLNFFIELGDTIYADFPSPALNKPQAETLDEFRLKHAEVYGQRFGQNTWADLRAVTSILATIDDHEVINDFEGGAFASRDPRFKDLTPGKLIQDTQLYENGLQAFQEYNPLRNDFYGATGDPRTAGERKLYRFNTYGSDAATFVLDARSFRDEGLPPVTNLADPTQVGQFLAQSFNPARTLLGRQQVEDLKRDLLAAETTGVTWKFVVIPEPIQNLGVLAASDRFEGYAAERTEILKFIDTHRINNVVFVAADIHGTVVNNLTYQLAPGQAQIATNAFEITTGSLAFDAPFGPTVAELAVGAGLLTADQKAVYDRLPTPGQDTFIKQIVDNGLTQLGYDPVGLNNNLAIANGLINANLLQGDYVATHTYGWTEFDIDQTSQKLTVTTYGIPYYTEQELRANPTEVTGRTPTIVSQFEVTPTLSGASRVASASGSRFAQSRSPMETELTTQPIIRNSPLFEPLVSS